jgi:hypothetical protein
MEEPDPGIDHPVFAESLLDVARRVVRDQQENRGDPDGVEVVTSLGTVVGTGRSG